MIFELNEEVLRRALLLEMEERMNAFSPAFYETHTFSRKFERKLRALQRRAELPRPVDLTFQGAKRVSVVLLAALVVLFATVMSVEALRVEFFRFVEEKFRTHSIVSYAPVVSDAEEQHLEDEFIVRRPTYIPEGFEPIEEHIRFNVHLYYKKGKNYCSYGQDRIEKSRMYINTEGAELEYLEFQGYPAQYLENIGSSMLMWDDGVYAYYVASDLGREVVFQIAESVKMVEK